ncbi:MAG: dolichyl-phosphate beta-glucosyltransferase [Candidatus Curtissbacteria bacterium]
MNIKLSVVVPVYNEEKRLGSGFDHYHSYLKKQKYSWEIIFVNDGSRDKTLNLLEEFVKDKLQVKIVTYPKNQGKGYAICQGMKKAQGKYILFTDLDHSVPIQTVETFFPYFEEGYSVVIGSRRVKGAKIAVHQKPLREFLGRGFTAIVNMFIYWGVADATCGFKAFESSVAKKIFSKITVYDWAFDAEILYICKKNNIKLAQAPVTWSDARGSKVSLKKDILRSFRGILKIRVNDLKGKYK